MTKISIVIPTYNRPGRLIEAVSSCLAQTLPPYEIIIGDDSSDFCSEAEVIKLKSKVGTTITYIHNIPSLGQAANVNMLFVAVNGEKVLLLHDDDLLLPDALATLSNCFIRDPEISVAYGKQYIITNDGTISVRRSEGYNRFFYRTKEYEGAKLTSLEAGLVQQFPNNAYLINISLARKVKYRDLGDACDFDFGLKVGQSGEKFCYTDVYTSKYRISEESVSNKSKNDAGLSAYMMVKDTIVPPASSGLKNKWLKERSGVAVGQAIANGKIRSAVNIYFSRDHLGRIPTPGGLKRLFLIVNHLLFGCRWI